MSLVNTFCIAQPAELVKSHFCQWLHFERINMAKEDLIKLSACS